MLPAIVKLRLLKFNFTTFAAIKLELLSLLSLLLLFVATLSSL